MGNKQSAPGKPENSKPAYVPNNNSNNGEHTPETTYNKIMRSQAIDILKSTNPKLMERGNKEEIETAIQEIIKQSRANAGNRNKNRLNELLSARNNATRAKIQERYNAENRENRRAKMTPEELAQNNELDELMKKGGRRMRKKSRKNRTKRKVKLI